MSRSRTGYKHTKPIPPSRGINISAAKKGKKFTEEHKQNLRGLDRKRTEENETLRRNNIKETQSKLRERPEVILIKKYKDLYPKEIKMPPSIDLANIEKVELFLNQ